MTILYSASAGHDFFDDNNDSRKTTTALEACNCIINIRAFDVPYHVWVAIDKVPRPPELLI